MPRPRLNRKIVRTSVSLEEHMFGEVSQLAAQNDASVAWLIRKAVAEFLERHRGKLAPQLPLLPPDSELKEYNK
ncbi:ribbon-helix-helix domain-containing protein [Burkholderia glumae]|nr:ribbon-helix-helix domain-containing protein [Burkholderia glumae]